MNKMNDKEKSVMCFGDSNTWGCDPAGGPRFDRGTRWPCILQETLGTGYHVVEEGLCGRTTVWDDPVEGDKNGLRHLTPLIQSHEPLDLVILMLGTNDLKGRFSVSALDVGNSIGRLVKATRECKYPFTGLAPEILVICPPPFADLSQTEFKDMFIGGEEKSRQIGPAVREYCRKNQIPMLNAGDVIRSSTRDGIHLDAPEHRKLGEAVAAEVRKLLL